MILTFVLRQRGGEEMNMTKLEIVLPIIFLILIYLLGFIGEPFFIILFFPLAFLVTAAITIKNFKQMKTLYKIAVCCLCLVLGGWGINRYIFPHRFYPVSIAGNLSIIAFFVFSVWSIIKASRTKRFLIVSVVFLLFIGVLSIVSIEHAPTSDDAAFAALQSLPYLSYVPQDKAEEIDGVVSDGRHEDADGLNLYNSYLFHGAHLVDMQGNFVHTWWTEKSHGKWFLTRLCEEGDLLVSIKERMLMKVGWDSEVKWARPMRSHHDMTITLDKKIYALSRKDDIVFAWGVPVPVLSDYILVLSPDGEILREVSLGKALQDHIPAQQIADIYAWMLNPVNLWQAIRNKFDGRAIFAADTLCDLFHNNTLTLIERDVPNLCKKGHILISARNLDLIGIFDVEREQLIWHWGKGQLQRPHHPTLLDNGNILIFDNGTYRQYTKLVELDPFSKKIVWEYTSDPPESFFCHYAGAAQRLSNGHTLVTDSAHGRVFEINRAGEMVWEFYNPEKQKDGTRRTIYRMMRITDPEQLSDIRNLMAF